MSADVPGAVCLALSSAIIVFKRRLLPGLALAGVALYVVYAICVAGTATHMAHRFFAVPIFLALLVLVHLISDERVAWGLAAAALAALIFLPNSPLRIGTDWYVMKPSPPARIDTKWFLHLNGGSLRGNLPPGAVVPRHSWYQDGLRFRESAERMRFGGPVRIGHPGMGFFGFAAGPSKYIVDPVALCDPLLARLPGGKWWTKWKPGHYRRALPAGYIQSIETGENRIRDPALARYYDEIRLITRGPLFDGSRLAAIVEMNLGLHDHLRDDYLERRERTRARRRKGAGS
jgi:arabinofuranosyltransferase